MTGGSLTIDWAPGEPIRMRGTATHVFEGELDLDALHERRDDHARLPAQFRRERDDRALARRPDEDWIVVNSCAVTNEAVRQTRQAIRRAHRRRPDARILVTGCAAELEPATLRGDAGGRRGWSAISDKLSAFAAQ